MAEQQPGIYQSFFELSKELLCILDKQFLIKDLSALFADVLQYSKEELKDIDFTRFIAAENQYAFKQSLQILGEEQHTEQRIKVINKSKNHTQLLLRVSKKSGDLYALKAEIFVSQDSPLARFKRFFDLELLDMMIVTDHWGRIILANKGFKNTLQYTSEELKGRSILRIIHPEDRRATALFMRELQKTEGALKEIINRFIDKQGRERWMSWRVIYVRKNLYAVANEITELKRQKHEIQGLLNKTMEQNDALINSKEDLKKTLETLKLRNFELDQFVYRTSHDLRAPLTSILGLVNLAKIDRKNGDMLLQYVEMIEKNTLKLDEFIQSLLDYSRSGRSEIVVSPIDFQELFDTCLEELAFVPGFNKLQKNLDITGNLTFWNDMPRLRTIFSNIISNALKYQKADSPDGHNFLKVHIDLSKGDRTFIRFEDNGTGIEAQYADKVFEMFFRAAENSKGSGLGLYIVEQSVKKLGGRIYLCSQENTGTIFNIELPNQTNEHTSQS